MSDETIHTSPHVDALAALAEMSAYCGRMRYATQMGERTVGDDVAAMVERISLSIAQHARWVATHRIVEPLSAVIRDNGQVIIERGDHCTVVADRDVDPTDRWYVVACRTCWPECTSARLIGEVPFRAPEDRMRWVVEHTKGTGHRSYLTAEA